MLRARASNDRVILRPYPRADDTTAH